MVMHDAILDISGGRRGILDEAVIDAAIHRPKTYLAYHEECTIHTVCAVLLDSIARNHAFADGNKRTGLMTAILTYELNNIPLRSGADATDEFENLVLWVVLKKPSIEEVSNKLEGLMNRYRDKSISGFAKKLRGILIPYDSDK